MFGGLLRIIENNPDVDFILAHFGGGIFVYALMPEISKALARTYFDTAASPYIYSATIFDAVRGIIGPEQDHFRQ